MSPHSAYSLKLFWCKYVNNLSRRLRPLIVPSRYMKTEGAVSEPAAHGRRLLLALGMQDLVHLQEDANRCSSKMFSSQPALQSYVRVQYEVSFTFIRLFIQQQALLALRQSTPEIVEPASVHLVTILVAPWIFNVHSHALPSVTPTIKLSFHKTI